MTPPGARVGLALLQTLCQVVSGFSSDIPVQIKSLLLVYTIKSCNRFIFFRYNVIVLQFIDVVPEHVNDLAKSCCVCSEFTMG
jgi:hypothetical protein